jgi:crotonobetainyl-CoA:carnitine CoA-transferase CaiB-like acyl-CoA transferase
MNMERKGPLARFKVLDLTRARAGPTAARHFADWGADVLKIETQWVGRATARISSTCIATSAA